MDANEYYLNLHMCKIDADEKKMQQIEDRANQLMKQGEECDPFTPDHVQEAIAQLELADAMLLGASIKSAFDLPNNTSAQVYLADFITDRVQDYWHKMAVWQAENEYDKKEW